MIAKTEDRWVQKINRYGRNRTPFFFLIDFEYQKVRVYKLSKLPKDVHFDFEGVKSPFQPSEKKRELHIKSSPMSFRSYHKGFKIVHNELKYGNSFLLNLTYPTKIATDGTLEDIYVNATAKYKLLYKDKFVCYSPETFIKIKKGKIYSYPMKGTIDASVPNAEQTILADDKELEEHYTIVDLIRNDLSQVAKEVHVSRFRYIDKIKAPTKDLLQVSSEIVGTLSEDFHDNLGDIFKKLLPAGSISGAPKKKTVEIIRKAEGRNRGYYTGVFGIYDGQDLSSAVAIRFIEQYRDSLRYRSGCGITHKSKAKAEYQEMIDKIYIPTA